MQKIRHSMLIGLVCTAVLSALSILAPPAANAALISNGIIVTVNTATVGNPVNAVVGVQGTLGNLVYDDGDLTGSGFESLPIRSPGESLTLPIGSETFVESDDIEFSLATDIPAAEFQNGAIQGLDFVVLFNFDGGGNLITKPFDSSDIGQDASVFIGDFYLDIDGDTNFMIGGITGWVEVLDDFGDGLELQPVGPTLVTGALTFVPEPSTGLLLGFGLVTFGIRRRIGALR